MQRRFINLKRGFNSKNSSDFYHGKWLRLETSENGEDKISRTTNDKYYSGVNILAIRGNKLITIGNFRIPTGRRILEIPAGLAEKGLTIEENILKELREETGYQDIDLWEDFDLEAAYGDPKRCCEHAYLRVGIIDKVREYLEFI